MTVTKEMIEAFCIAECDYLRKDDADLARWPEDYDDDELETIRAQVSVGLTAALSAQPAPAVAVPDGWRPISEADREITHQQHFPDIDLTIRNSDRYWVRDADGRVYEASWTEDGKGRDYWWDWDGESPVDPIEFMPHPLDPRFAAAPVSVAACRMCGGKGWHAGDPEGAAIEECSECNGGTSTPVAVPAGWKLVPVEPTAEMITGACRATVLGEDEDSEPVYLEPREALSAYSAMLAAAPQPPMPTVEPVEVHPDDIAVDRFAAAMKAKLAKKRREGVSGWDDPEQCHIDYLTHLLCEQIHSRAALDPIDIGNFAMMIFNRQENPTHGR